MDKLEERMELSMLYDFYGALLKEKQQEILELYLMDDLSVTEIAEKINITRQGVHDALKRATKQLYGYEEKLELLERFEEQREAVKKVKEKLQNMGMSEESAKWQEILEMLEKIIE